MKAVRLTAVGSPLVEEGIEVPQVGTSDVLVRVRAAGICHSDAHYRAGVSPVARLPLTLGHEVAGVVEQTGEQVANFRPGDRVCIHYLVTCGTCASCRSGNEQFCATAEMIGKHRDGGYAEFILLPERSVFRLPDEIPFEEGAILMCSSATSLHALNKARFRAGEVVAVFGAVPINATEGEAVESIREMTNGRGVNVALELVGLPVTMRQAVQSLGRLGRAALVGLSQEAFDIAPYAELLNKEAEIIGVSDHLASEIPVLLELARTRKLDLSHGIIRTIRLEAGAVNAALDRLEYFSDDVRVVIVA